MLIPTEVAVNLTLTERAASKIKALLAKETNAQQALRVQVDGGGCSGFQYAFKFDDVIDNTDIRIDIDGATLVVDAVSYQYLIGSEVDFVDSLEGSQFVITNPNATATCGCGTSFSV